MSQKSLTSKIPDLLKTPTQSVIKSGHFKSSATTMQETPQTSSKNISFSGSLLPRKVGKLMKTAISRNSKFPLTNNKQLETIQSVTAIKKQPKKTKKVKNALKKLNPKTNCKDEAQTEQLDFSCEIHPIITLRKRQK
jgi:hypothetical protein